MITTLVIRPPVSAVFIVPNLQHHAGPASGPISDLQRASDRLRALPHRTQPYASTGCGDAFRADPHTVILDQQADVRRAGRDRDLDAACTGMAKRVRHRLL